MGGSNAPKRYLVTGGCGFIGSHLVDSLLTDGHEVTVLDDLSSGRRDNLDRRAELLVGDVADLATVVRAMEGAAACFHLAAISSVAKSTEDWLGTHRTNQSATICVFNAARATPEISPRPVVYASSAAIYGNAAHNPIMEHSPTRPLTAYGADKLGSELHAAVAWEVHDIPTIGLRFFNVFGPRQDASSPYSGVISIFADRLRAGLPITIFGDGSQVRDFIYVADVVACLRQAMDNCVTGAKAYNVCTGEPTSICHLAQLIGDLLGQSPDVEFRPWRSGDIRISLGSPELANQELRFRAQTKLAAGLRKLLAQ